MSHDNDGAPDKQERIVPTEEELDDIEVSEVDTSDVRGGAAVPWHSQ